MVRVAQALAALFTLILGAAGLTLIFAPWVVEDGVGITAGSDYAITNFRTFGAPVLSIAVITAFGALHREWTLLLPASFYFLFNASARIISVFAEGLDQE